MTTEVFVLELAYEYEASKVLGVFATERLAKDAAEAHFKEHSGHIYFLDYWFKGMAQVMRGDGTKVGECYDVARFEVVC